MYMAIRCSYCSRDYDATLFEFNRSITCICGRTVTFRHEEKAGDRGVLVKKKKLLFLGDSLIEYYDWAERFADYDVHNLGIAGETVEGLASRLGRILRELKAPDIVFIMSGINNMAMED